MSSELNISRNIFLEKEELIRFQGFLKNNTVDQVMLDNTSKWGIVRTVFEGVSPDFLIEVGSNVGTIKMNSDSKAVDKDKLLIKQPAVDNISVPNDGNFYWVKISHKFSPLEVGECSIDINGYVTGVNTKFSEVIRGQSSEVPVKIKFYKSSGLINDSVYEVVSLDDQYPDTQILLSGAGFIAESGLNYIVIGSVPVGEVITNQQLEGLYKYDSCNIELIQETTLDTAPTIDFITDKQFYLARVVNNSGVVTVEDKRGDQFLSFNVEGLSSKLDKNNNLSDLSDKELSRANLGVYSTEEVDELISGNSVGWVNMDRGVAAQSTGFSLKVCRIGRTLSISGRFKPAANVNGQIIASLPLATIAPGLSLTNKIWSQSNEISSGSTNYGISFYVDVFSPDLQPTLKLVCDTNYGGELFGIQYAFVNMTFLII